MSWHAAYWDRVLAPDYEFAGRHLLPHFLDALTAHLDAVACLPAMQGADTQAQVRALRADLVALHDQPAPPQQVGVPDLFFALQRELERHHGEAVGHLRVGLSRNDLDMTVYKMRARELLLATGERLVGLRAALLDRAEQHLGTVLIAQTHHQPGQPTTVAHYLTAVEALLARNSQRLAQAYARLNRSPLGAAALAGSSHPLDRELTARLLAFDGPVMNTYDAVASSDWEADVVTVTQLIALDMSRFVCDLLAWASSGLYRLGDSLVQGSSIMPQKRNPVSLEHARTRFSRALGAAGMVLYSSHNIPFTDLNDFGPDVQGALQAQHAQLEGGLALLHACIEDGDFDRDALRAAAAATDTTATELADVLARDACLSFPAAHAVVGRLVRRMHTEGRPLTQATPDDLVAVGGPALTPEVLREALAPEAFVLRRRGIGMPAPEVMTDQLARARDRLAADREALRESSQALVAARTQLRGNRRENA